MEACMRAYIGGAKQPLMLSSVSKITFLGTYYFNKGRYANPVAGLTRFNPAENEFSAIASTKTIPCSFRRACV